MNNNTNPLYNYLTEIYGWKYYGPKVGFDISNVDYLLLKRSGKNYIQNLLKQGYTKEQALQQLKNKLNKMLMKGKPTEISSTGYKFWNQPYKRPIERLYYHVRDLQDRIEQQSTKETLQKDIKLLK